MDLSVSFDKQIIEGTATLNLTIINDTDFIYLDMVALEIQSVNLVHSENNSQALKFAVDDPKPYLGKRLMITLPSKIKQYQELQIAINYKVLQNEE